jgi:hypothetical protein
MRPPHGLPLITAAHLFEGILPHRLQEPEATSSLAILLGQDQTLVDQRGQALQHIDRAVLSIREDGLCRLQGEPTDKDAQTAEQHLLVGGEELRTPGDGRAQGVLSHGKILRLPVEE